MYDGEASEKLLLRQCRTGCILRIVRRYSIIVYAQTTTSTTAMELRVLQHIHLIALVGVIERVVMADKLVNEQEEEFVRWLMDEVGTDRYIDALDDFDGQYSEEDLWTLLENITDKDIREIIYGTVLEASTIHALIGENTEFMDKLARLWNLEIRIDDVS
jgi:hypothetical protein